MRNQVDAKRKDVSFHVGDWVFLKLQPYRQISLIGHPTMKISKRFFGPFQISEKIGAVAYCLTLPDHAQLHDVFHVSKLKRCWGDPTVQQLPLPTAFKDNNQVFQPAEILQSRVVLQHDQPHRQYLIRWENQAALEASWVDEAVLRQNFPRFHLEDTVNVKGRANVAVNASNKDSNVIYGESSKEKVECKKNKDNKCGEHEKSGTVGRPRRGNRVLMQATRFKDFVV